MLGDKKDITVLNWCQFYVKFPHTFIWCAEDFIFNNVQHFKWMHAETLSFIYQMTVMLFLSHLMVIASKYMKSVKTGLILIKKHTSVWILSLTECIQA